MHVSFNCFLFNQFEMLEVGTGVPFRYRQLNIAILYYRIAEKLEHPRILGTSYPTCYWGLDFFLELGLVWVDLVVYQVSTFYYVWNWSSSLLVW